MEKTIIDFDKEIDFEALCPEIFSEFATLWVDETFGEDLYDQQYSLLSIAEVDGLCDEDKMEYVAEHLSFDTDRMEAIIFDQCDLKDIFDTAIKDPAFLEVVKQYCEHEEVNLDYFISADGNLDYNKLLMHTDIRDVVLAPFCEQIINSDVVQEGMEKQLSELKTHYEELAAPANKCIFNVACIGITYNSWSVKDDGTIQYNSQIDAEIHTDDYDELLEWAQSLSENAFADPYPEKHFVDLDNNREIGFFDDYNYEYADDINADYDKEAFNEYLEDNGLINEDESLPAYDDEER